jgi:membrane protein required for beta-lactamase induction
VEFANVNLVTSHVRWLALFDWAQRIAQRFAAVLVWLLGPLSLIAYAFAAWRVASDIGWSSSFFISAGFFSHWLVWLSVGLALSISASMLNDGPAPADSGGGANLD